MDLEDDRGLIPWCRVDGTFISGRTRAWAQRIGLRSVRDGRLNSAVSVLFESASDILVPWVMVSPQLTLLNAILLGTSVALLSCDTLNALIVVVLGGMALLGLLALCR